MKKCINILKNLFRIYVNGEMNLNKLKKQGLIIGENFNMQRKCIIDCSFCYLIKIGNNVTMAPRFIILAHDASTKNTLGYTKIGRVIIGDNVFIGAGAIILPNVTIDSNVIIGAGSVVTKNLSSGVYAGNPVRYISSFDDYIKKNKNKIKNNFYDSSYQIQNLTKEKKKEILEKISDISYIE